MDTEEPPTHCGRPMVPVLYGYPSAEMFAAAALGEIVLGGCIIRDPMTTYVCRVCDVKIEETFLR